MGPQMRPKMDLEKEESRLNLKTVFQDQDFRTLYFTQNKGDAKFNYFFELHIVKGYKSLPERNNSTSLCTLV